jgi:hypothetical protein
LKGKRFVTRARGIQLSNNERANDNKRSEQPDCRSFTLIRTLNSRVTNRDVRREEGKGEANHGVLEDHSEEITEHNYGHRILMQFPAAQKMK